MGKSKEPLDYPSRLVPGGFLMFRLKGTVIESVWWQVLFVVIYTVGIVLIQEDIPFLHMNFPDTLIDILGVVTGLLLCFRTDSAFARYTEGRLLWSQITNNIRCLTRGIWHGVKENDAKELVKKKSALDLLVGFAYATKHYLRDEYAYDYPDLENYVNHLPKFATPSSVQPLSKQKDDLEIKYAAYDRIAPTNIPIEITYYISDYLKDIAIRHVAPDDIIEEMQGALRSMVEALTAFERIQRTPIPLAYSVHLHHSVWLYILALPFQIVGQLDWWTIPSVGIAAYSLLGILAIGWEIENPFGYDTNDLPLDDFCVVIKCEIDMIIRSKVIPPSEWIYSNDNHPLAPRNMTTSQELSYKSLPELHALLKGEHYEDPDELQKSYSRMRRVKKEDKAPLIHTETESEV